MERLFKWFTLEDKLTKARLVWFTTYFESIQFDGTDAVLFHFLKYCADLDITAKKKYLESYLKTEGKKVIKLYNIRLDTMLPMDYNEPGTLEEAYRIITTAVLAKYDAYCAIKIEEEDSFKVAMRLFLSIRKNIELQNLFSSEYPKLLNGEVEDDIIANMQLRLSELEDMYNVEKIDRLDFLRGESNMGNQSDIMRFLIKTGIPCIDGDIGGVFSKQCWTFTGQPGSGKTRFILAQFAYQAAVVYKMDVLIDELELTKGEVENILIAHHISNMYENVKIPDKLINRGNLSPEQERIVQSARIDLFESGKYGTIVINIDDLYVERLAKTRLQYFRLNRKTQIWIIDYLGLLLSKPIDKYDKHLAQYEVIAKGIKIAKKVAKTADIGVICINQFTKEGIEAAFQGKRINPGMVEGGQVIQRHSDYDIAMTMTYEQQLANLRELSTVKQRAASGFRNTPLRADLAISRFRQEALQG